MTKLQRRKVVFVVASIVIAILVLLAAFRFFFNNKPSVKESITESTNFSIEKAVKEKNIDDLKQLIEFEGEAYVVEITDIDSLKKAEPLFSRSYNGDIIVFLSDKTIVYDGSTKTVRDIISKTFLDELKQPKK